MYRCVQSFVYTHVYIYTNVQPTSSPLLFRLHCAFVISWLNFYHLQKKSFSDIYNYTYIITSTVTLGPGEFCTKI